MVGHVGKKRRNEHKTQRPKKKLRRVQQEYNSDSESEQETQNAQDFDAVNLLDSDDDIHNANVDDGAPEMEEDDGSSGSDEGEGHEETKEKPSALRKKTSRTISKKPAADPDQEELDEEDEVEEEDGESELEDDGDEDVDMESSEKKPKSKRNDPTAFATSLSKILSTKLSTSKRTDPVLSRSAAALEASKAAVDNALETKAKRKLKEQKRIAMEKGRVRDVLVPATYEGALGEPEMTTSEILETERKLRKIAQKGVVRLFNAVRAAQVKAAEAEKATRKDGVIGVKNREEKVNALSKKGFLDLIASGGGGLRKGPLEEA